MLHRDSRGRVTEVVRESFTNDKLYYNHIFALKCSSYKHNEVTFVGITANNYTKNCLTTDINKNDKNILNV